MEVTIGIDPGLEGACYIRNASVSGNSFAIATSVGVIPQGVRHIFIDNALLLCPNNPKEWGDEGFLYLFSGLTGDAAIEKVGGMPRNQGMFRFGQGYQGLRLAVVCQGLTLTDYRPQVWQHLVGLRPKENYWELAMKQYPELHNALVTKRGRALVDRAAALLIHDAHLIQRGKINVQISA